MGHHIHGPRESPKTSDRADRGGWRRGEGIPYLGKCHPETTSREKVLELRVRAKERETEEPGVI